MTASKNCVHCQLPIPPSDLVIDTIHGQELHFCCRGCQGVYRIISGAGLGQFYEQRTWDEKGVPGGVFESEFDEEALSSHIISQNDGCSEITALIDGIRCASCIWLLEKIVKKQKGVLSFRINYGTHQAVIKFNPQETSSGTIFRSISQLGYLPLPYSFGTAQLSALQEKKALLVRFGTAAFLSMQLMGFSFALYAGFFHSIAPEMRLIFQYFSALVATPVVFYSGWPFLIGAWRNLVNRSASMDLLISLGVLSAYCYSIYALANDAEVYFDTAAMIITLILLGRIFESSARHRAISSVEKLLRLAPDSATKICGGKTQTVPSSNLLPKDNILVKAGERVPVDCILVEGETEFDESSITGESMPVLRKENDEIIAGTLNLISSVTLRVEKKASESFIARMAKLVEEAQSRQAPIQSIADRVATYFVPVVTLIAFSTWYYWLTSFGSHELALLNGIAVLIVACPCALGLATPTAVLAATANASNRGILFRGGDVLEAAARLDLVVFDKTGTLTEGKPVVTSLLPRSGKTTLDLLKLVDPIVSSSNHPLAQSIKTLIQTRGIKSTPIESIQTIAGRGLKKLSGNKEILIGSRIYLSEQGITVPEFDSKNLTEVHVSLNKQWYGVFLIEDSIRPEALETVLKIQSVGLKTVLLTGDHAKAAKRVCDALSISDYQANMSPAGKKAWVAEKQSQNQIVMMVGDGINDAPALAQANIGCAMVGGTDIALETSDLVLSKPHLDKLFEALLIAKKALSVVKQNLFWAFSYNMITIPLAASGKLAPVWAAVAMASSSLFVVGNSLRLGRNVKNTFIVAKKAHKD